MKTWVVGYWSYCSLRLSHPILYRTRADSEAARIQWFSPWWRRWKRRCREWRWAAQQGRARWGGAGMQSRPGCKRERVHTDPEWVEVVLIMLSQLPMWVTGSEQGPAGQSSLLGIAWSKAQGWWKGLPEGKWMEVKNVPSWAWKENNQSHVWAEASTKHCSGPGVSWQQDTKQAQSWKGAMDRSCLNSTLSLHGGTHKLAQMHSGRWIQGAEMQASQKRGSGLPLSCFLFFLLWSKEFEL